jgi:alpha-glucosidase
MLGATYFFLQGTPFIYQGQEIGMTNGDFKSMDDLRDVEAKNVDALTKKLFFLRPLIKKHMLSLTRDNARTPMQWDNSKYAGFSKVEPWIKVNANKETINTEADINSDKSINRFYRSLIEFRKGNDVIKNGEYICLNKSDNKVFIYKRVLGEKEIVVVSNFTKKEIKVKYLDKLDKHNLVLFNYQNKTNKLLPFETRVYKNY